MAEPSNSEKLKKIYKLLKDQAEIIKSSKYNSSTAKAADYTDDNHDEQVKVSQADDKMAEPSNSEKMKKKYIQW